MGIHQEPETGQWVWFRLRWDKKEVKWQTAGGTLRRKTERNIVQWITGDGGGEEGWTLERRKGNLCSNPTNFGLLTWAILWYEEGGGVVVGEMVEILKMIARRNGRTQLPGGQINALMRELMNYGPIGEWERIAGITREGGAGEGRVKETKRRKVQQGIREFKERQKKIGESARDEGAYRGQSDCEGVPIREKPSRWDWQGTAFANEGRDWSSVAGSCPGTSRVVSQNVGPVGFRNSKKLVDTIIQLHQPAVILLQDCRVKKDRIKEATAEARKRWSEHKKFHDVERKGQ